jgi:choline dehydrogenase-like flavoprotein
MPGADASTDDALAAAVRAGFEIYQHPVGTCRMGPSSEPGAVVDPRGAVHGIDGLSVVDASIMPSIPAANTNVPTIMIAERCAAWLRGEESPSARYAVCSRPNFAQYSGTVIIGGRSRTTTGIRSGARSSS